MILRFILDIPIYSNYLPAIPVALAVNHELLMGLSVCYAR